MQSFQGASSLPPLQIEQPVVAALVAASVRGVCCYIGSDKTAAVRAVLSPQHVVVQTWPAVPEAPRSTASSTCRTPYSSESPTTPT